MLLNDIIYVVSWFINNFLDGLKLMLYDAKMVYYINFAFIFLMF